MSPAPDLTKPALRAVILAAGRGTRMRSARPKVLHPLAGRPMVQHLAAALAALGPAEIVVVTAPGEGEVAAAVAPAAGAATVTAAAQDPPLGTGHAVLAAKPALGSRPGTVLVVYGDTPLLSETTLREMVARREQGAAVVVVGFRPADTAAYGRLILDAAGTLARIVEHRDASAEERAVDLCNSGVMAVDGVLLFDLLAGVTADNAKGEYYLTDIVALARGRGLACAMVEAPEAEVLGINSRRELAVAEALVQDRLRERAMAGGASLLDPASVHLSWDTAIGQDVIIEPHVFCGLGVAIGDNVVIRAFSHLEGARIKAGAIVGPFARLRPGARIGEGVHIGNFVEIKNAGIEAGAKVNHLSYVGDARVGAGANIGAGTITCNYDGIAKHHTDIGAGAFIGSNSALVAPVTIGDGAMVGAGSTIAGTVAPGALAVTRAEQKEFAGGAERFRTRARARVAKKAPAAPAPRSKV